MHLDSAVVGHQLVLHVLLHCGLFSDNVNVGRSLDAAHNRRYQTVDAECHVQRSSCSAGIQVAAGVVHSGVKNVGGVAKAPV